MHAFLLTREDWDDETVEGVYATQDEAVAAGIAAWEVGHDFQPLARTVWEWDGALRNNWTSVQVDDPKPPRPSPPPPKPGTIAYWEYAATNQLLRSEVERETPMFSATLDRYRAWSHDVLMNGYRFDRHLGEGLGVTPASEAPATFRRVQHPATPLSWHLSELSDLRIVPLRTNDRSSS